MHAHLPPVFIFLFFLNSLKKILKNKISGEILIKLCGCQQMFLKTGRILYDGAWLARCATRGFIGIVPAVLYPKLDDSSVDLFCVCTLPHPPNPPHSICCATCIELQYAFRLMTVSATSTLLSRTGNNYYVYLPGDCK